MANKYVEKISEEDYEQMVAEMNAQKKPFSYYAPILQKVALAVAVLIALAALILPAPYNPQYLAKRLLLTPYAECNDGFLIFTRTDAGFMKCRQEHGGFKQMLNKDK
ncbi:MAG: hypothetical protein M3033_12780 [Acidobacteriota bacterium]|nr:hypothetical protein [Acidobacteriota bacterium]